MFSFYSSAFALFFQGKNEQRNFLLKARFREIWIAIFP
jgi:hypothetical protein